MELIYNYWTGHPSRLNLTRCVGSYLRADSHYHVKVGITNNPRIRSNAHRKKFTWEKMIVIYETSSLSYVRDVEKMLIEHLYEKCTAECNIINEVGGGGGDFGDGPYYVYLLFSDKWRLRPNTNIVRSS